jgi:hypothetical protein
VIAGNKPAAARGSADMFDRRILPTLAVAIPLVALALGHHLTRELAWLGGFELAVTAGLGVAALATIAATWARLRWLGIATTAGMLVAYIVYVLGEAAGMQLVPIQPPDPRFAVVLSAGTLLGVAGLVARRQWARWLCLALGAAGVGAGGLNMIHTWDLGGTPGLDLELSIALYRLEWMYLVTSIGGALIVVNLVAARDAFVAGEAWNRSEPVVRALRATLLASFVAVPMLLVYAWMQPLVAATVPTALAIAGALVVGAVLAVRGRLIGALILVVAGAGLVAQSLATVLLAEQPRIALYYLVFWAPAAVAAIVAGALLARPTLRILRR